MKHLTKSELLAIVEKQKANRVKAGKARWIGVSPEERSRITSEAGKKGGRPRKLKVRGDETEYEINIKYIKNESNQ